MTRSLHLSLVAATLALGTTLFGSVARADGGDTVRWQAVNGIVAAGNVVGTGTGASTGGPTPWSTLDGHARVDLARGRFDFEVRGLVLAGGNAIGTPGAVTQVKGTLVCDTDGSASGGNSVFVDTPLVELSERGDARFEGTLGPLPASCTSEPDMAFLVRVAAGKWIANGSVLR